MKYRSATIVLCALLFTLGHANSRRIQVKADDSASQYQTGNSSAVAVGGSGGNISATGIGNNNKNGAYLNFGNSGGQGGLLTSLGGREVRNDTGSGNLTFTGGTAGLDVSGGSGGNAALSNIGNGNANTHFNLNSGGGNAGIGFSQGGEARSKGKTRHWVKGSGKHHSKHQEQKVHKEKN